MNEQEVAIKLNDHDHEIGSLKHKVKGCEENQKALAEPTIEQIDPIPLPTYPRYTALSCSESVTAKAMVVEK